MTHGIDSDSDVGAYDNSEAASNSGDDDRSPVREQQGCCAKIIEYYSERETADLRQKEAWIEVQVCLNRISERLKIIEAELTTYSNKVYSEGESFENSYPPSPDQILKRLEDAIRFIGFQDSLGRLKEAPSNFEAVFYYYDNLSKMNNSMLGYWVKRLGIALAAAAAGCAAGFKLSAVAAPVLGPWAPVVGGVIGGAVGFFGSRAALSSKEKLYAEINTLGEKFSKVEGFDEQKAIIDSQKNRYYSTTL